MTVSSDQQDPSNDTFITTSTNEAAEAGGGNGVVDSPQILTQHPLINPAAVNFNNDVGNLDNLPEYMASQLKLHDTKIISEFKQNKLLNDAAKNWDYFYKRNSTHFFKDRHWLEREFSELRPTSTLTTTTTTTNTTTTTTTTAASNDDTSLPSFSDSNDILVKAGTLPPLRNLLEIGCGVGNFIFPLIAANHELFVYGCDFSKR